MNILIILKTLKNELDIEQRYGNLLEQAKHWASKDNEVYVLGIKTPDKWKDAGFKFLKNSKYLPPKLRAFSWFVTGNHPRVDVVVASTSTLNFHYKKTATVLYIPTESSKPSLKFSDLLKDKIMYLFLNKFFSKGHYFISSYNQIAKLKKVHNDKIFFLKTGLPKETDKIIVRENTLGHSVLFASNSADIENYNFAIKVFSHIDRKEEGWIFTMIVNKSLYKKVKSVITKTEFQNRVNVWVYESRKTILRELSRADFFLDTIANGESVFNNILAMRLRTLVVTYHSGIISEYEGFEKFALVSMENDYMKMAENVVEVSKNNGKMKKLIEDAFNFSSSYSWKNLAKESLSFLERIRPE